MGRRQKVTGKVRPYSLKLIPCRDYWCGVNMKRAQVWHAPVGLYSETCSFRLAKRRQRAGWLLHASVELLSEWWAGWDWPVQWCSFLSKCEHHSSSFFIYQAVVCILIWPLRILPRQLKIQLNKIISAICQGTIIITIIFNIIIIIIIIIKIIVVHFMILREVNREYNNTEINITCQIFIRFTAHLTLENN